MLWLFSTIFHCVAGKVAELQFDQRLDHFSNSSATFPQRYWVIDDFWDGNQRMPVFLFLGLGAPLDGSTVQYLGIFGPALKTHKALGVAIENRYYGRSMNADMLKLDNLCYLTFEQSLEDTVTIQDEVILRYNLTGEQKWFTFGGSYSGMKSVLHRLHKSDRFYAAFASSAPVAFDNDMGRYMGHVGDWTKLKQYGGSELCYQNVRVAYAEVDRLLTAGNFEQLRADFNICSSVQFTHGDKDKYAVGRHLGGLIADIGQYSFADPATNTYSKVCLPFTRPGTTPYEALKRLRYEGNPGGCETTGYQALLDDLQAWQAGVGDWTLYDQNPGGPSMGLRPSTFSYEICANMGFNAYCSEDQGCPLSQLVTKQGQFDMCQDVFNISAEQMKSTNEHYLNLTGGRNPPTTRLIATHGATDMGFEYEINVTDEARQVYSLTTPFCGHILDLNAAKPYDPIVLGETRKAIAGLLAMFVDEAMGNTNTPTTANPNAAPKCDGPKQSAAQSIRLHCQTTSVLVLVWLLL